MSSNARRVARSAKTGVSHVPPAATSAGEEAVELAAMAGIELDPWQELVLRESLGEREGGKWAAFEVGLIVPRQNGKGTVLEARGTSSDPGGRC
jgi:hypothetical protein